MYINQEIFQWEKELQDFYLLTIRCITNTLTQLHALFISFCLQKSFKIVINQFLYFFKVLLITYFYLFLYIEKILCLMKNIQLKNLNFSNYESFFSSFVLIRPS